MLEFLGLKKSPQSREAAYFSALGERLLKEYGVSHSELVPAKGPVGFTGFTDSNELLIGAPWPTETASSLFILAHEIGHLRLHVRRNSAGWYRLADKPAYLLEYEAERFAEQWFAQNGLTVPKQERGKARDNVREKLALAADAGDGTLDPEIAEWLALDGPASGALSRQGEDERAGPAAPANLLPEPRCGLGIKHVPAGATSRGDPMVRLALAIVIIGLIAALWARFG